MKLSYFTTVPLHWVMIFLIWDLPIHKYTFALLVIVLVDVISFASGIYRGLQIRDEK